ncbi:MAG TPA: hypothetical protein VLN59_13160 [Burkholderiales bacterium]|nr:hypothetical protein [Burkholderiales bacterium]
MDIEVSPIAGWQIGTIGNKRAVIFRPHYLDHSNQKVEEATPGRYYAMTASQCLSLICELTAAVHDLENAQQTAQRPAMSPISRGRNHSARATQS